MAERVEEEQEFPTDFAPFDNKKFVQVIKRYPLLYNQFSREHSNKSAVDQAWKKISKEMKISANQCKIRWKNIRTCFQRQYRSKPQAGRKLMGRAYYLTEDLSFLRPFLKPVHFYNSIQSAKSKVLKEAEELEITVPIHSVVSSAEESELSLDNIEGFDEQPITKGVGTSDTNAFPVVKIEDTSNESEIVYDSSTIEISNCTTESSTEEKRRKKSTTVENERQEEEKIAEEEETYTVLKSANNRDVSSIFVEHEHVASEVRKPRPKPQVIRKKKLKPVANERQEEEKIEEEEESYTVLKTSNNRDGSSIFGEHVAIEIRKLRPKPQAIVKHLISNILFEAAMGKYDSPSQQAYYSNNSASRNDLTTQQLFQTDSSTTQGMTIIPVYINEDDSVSSDLINRS